MFNIVIFGAPGSGKGTQSEKLIDRYGLSHISTGDLLRDHIRRGTTKGKVAESFISQGMLIPDELMLDILSAELDSMPKPAGVIFDGFPRTIAQAEALQKLLEARGSGIHAVIGLEVPDEELIERLVKRGAVSGRSDDNPETIQKRLEVYHRQTSPLRDYYIAREKYTAIPGTGSIDEIFGHITDAIDPLQAAD